MSFSSTKTEMLAETFLTDECLAPTQSILEKMNQENIITLVTMQLLDGDIYPKLGFFWENNNWVEFADEHRKQLVSLSEDLKDESNERKFNHCSKAVSFCSENGRHYHVFKILVIALDGEIPSDLMEALENGMKSARRKLVEENAGTSLFAKDTHDEIKDVKHLLFNP